jgi:AraC-like DNA-binding protein
VQHIEFLHTEHFDRHYNRIRARRTLRGFIDFFWETDFDALWKQHPKGFSDALFPNVGYTYLINLGTPFTMQLQERLFEIKTDGFLPRHLNMICHHHPGNRIFGIKFLVSPVVFQKKINFFEYREFIFPLAYLIDRVIIEKVRSASTFRERVEIISDYYQEILDRHLDSASWVTTVTETLKQFSNSSCSLSVESAASAHRISTRTLQRYFEAATGTSCKQAFQMMRIRKAVDHLVDSPGDFSPFEYGYYDHSHFYKHLKSFLTDHPADVKDLHRYLLKRKSECG